MDYFLQSQADSFYSRLMVPELFAHLTVLTNDYLIEMLVIHSNTWNHLIVCK